MRSPGPNGVSGEVPYHSTNWSPFFRLLGADDFVIAMAPAQAQEVVAYGLRQEAHIAIRIHP